MRRAKLIMTSMEKRITEAPSGLIEEGRERARFRMHDGMRLGAPTLRIKNLEEVLSFYESNLGLKANRNYQDSDDSLGVLELGFKSNRNDSEPILILKQDPKAAATRHDFAGLYHYAVLVPDRKSLASTYLAIEGSGASYDGFADHTFSESLYMHDVERNGIEIYADRPRNTWGTIMEAMSKGDVRGLMSLNKPLDLDSLLMELKGDETSSRSPFPRGARIGHIHLRITNLERSVRFYHEKLGLDVRANLPEMGAAFLSVGGYHHQVGLNTWHSLGGSPHKDGQAGMENFTIRVPDVSVLDVLATEFPDSPVKNGRLSISDPDGIRILIEVER